MDTIDQGRALMLVDPYFFLVSAGDTLQNPEYAALLEEFITHHKSAVIHLFAGELYRPGARFEHFRPNGFTLYFPLYVFNINRRLSRFLEDTGTAANSFIMQNSWDNFVIKFAKMVDFGD